jgi:hypothetical protein
MPRGVVGFCVVRGLVWRFKWGNDVILGRHRVDGKILEGSSWETGR